MHHYSSPDGSAPERYGRGCSARTRRDARHELDPSCRGQSTDENADVNETIQRPEGRRVLSKSIRVWGFRIHRRHELIDLIWYSDEPLVCCSAPSRLAVDTPFIMCRSDAEVPGAYPATTELSRTGTVRRNQAMWCLLAMAAALFAAPCAAASSAARASVPLDRPPRPPTACSRICRHPATGTGAAGRDYSR